MSNNKIFRIFQIIKIKFIDLLQKIKLRILNITFYGLKNTIYFLIISHFILKLLIFPFMVIFFFCYQDQANYVFLTRYRLL